MPKISVDDISQYSASSNGGSKASFFALKNDKDYAFVRIMHTNKSDFDVNVVHSVVVDGKQKKVNCLRTASEPTANCPLCAAGERIQTRMYVHLLQYTQQQDGTWVAEPKIFDRGRDYIEKIGTLAETYAPLHATVFKVVRNGKAGDQTTTYEFLPMPPSYSADVYPYYEDDLQYEPALGSAVWDKNKADLEYYVENKEFPRTGDNANDVQRRPAPTAPAAEDTSFVAGPRRRI